MDQVKNIQDIHGYAKLQNTKQAKKVYNGHKMVIWKVTKTGGGQFFVGDGGHFFVGDTFFKMGNEQEASNRIDVS